MTDYSKWKVNDLKAELKKRGIPQTGLRVKQNFIDRLIEEDEKGENGDSTEEAPDAAPDATVEEGDEKEEGDEQEPEQNAQQEPAEVPAESQEPQPQENPEAKPEEKPEEEPKQEQEAVAQDVGADEAQDEPKAAEEPQSVDNAVEEQSQHEEPAKPAEDTSSKASEQAQAPDEMDHEPTSAPAAQPEETEAPAEPVEQASREAVAQAPMPVEKNASVAPSGSEAGTGVSTPLPAEEVLEDRRKRKRRSQTPIPTPEAVANKKARAEDGSPRVVLPEDGEGAPSEAKAPQESVPAPGPSEERANDQIPQQEENQESTDRPSIPEEPRARKNAPLKQDARFKGLFAAERDQPRAASPPQDTVMEDAEVEPALHAATSALYVDGLMRPMQPNALRNHIVSLASGPGASPKPDVVVDFYLDPIKTHCFASFANVAAASRVRSGLHNTVWPKERDRKTLFVDFIPENKVQEWIGVEEGSRQRGGPAPRWEVKYDRTEDGVEAVLEKFDPKNAASRGRQPSHSNAPHPAPPTGPRGSIGVDKEDQQPSGPPPAEPRPRPGQGFKPLDELFESTTAKPKLYYLPVPRAVADRRLDRFDDLLRKGEYPRRGGDETRRITFEDDDLFVDVGPEYSARSRRRGRGGGFGGGSWRGGGRRP